MPAPKWSKESVSPDGESTAPPSDRSDNDDDDDDDNNDDDRSDRSSGHLTSDRGSGLLQSERSSGHLHSSERDSGIGGITIGPVVSTRGPRAVTNGDMGDMIIGNQPALDVDAIIRQQQGGVRGPGENGQAAIRCRSPGTENRKSSPVESEGSAASQQVQTSFVHRVYRVKYSAHCPVLRTQITVQCCTNQFVYST